MLSYIHITEFVILAFFFQDVLFITYYWSYLSKELSIFSSSYKTAKLFIQKNQYLTRLLVPLQKIYVLLRESCFTK